MTRHLIVTCGTSQIMNEKIDQLQLREFSESFQALAGAEERGNPAALSTEMGFAELTGALLEEWNELSSLIGKDVNFFGAELSTLWVMSQTSDVNLKRKAFVPATDVVTLLCSDTKAGAFCAAVLQKVLAGCPWQLSGPKVVVRPVPGLRERPSSAAEADGNLYTAVAKSVRPGCHNDLVFTGGFKSSIPTLALFAFLHGRSLFCLFERSAQLHEVRLPDDVYDKLQPCVTHLLPEITRDPKIIYPGAEM